MPRWNGGQLSLDAGAVLDENVSANTVIDADKLQHLYKPATNFALAIGGTVATREELVFVADTAGTLRLFSCLMVSNGTTGDSDFDLKVNGSSVLSAAVNQGNGDTDATVKDGTISTPSISAGDYVSIAVTRNSSHDGTGPIAWVVIEQTAPV